MSANMYITTEYNNRAAFLPGYIFRPKYRQ